jgi:hypothetical protein
VLGVLINRTEGSSITQPLAVEHHALWTAIMMRDVEMKTIIMMSPTRA